jgi:hypothetical protein
MVHVTCWPKLANDSEQDELRYTRPCLGLRIQCTFREPSSQVFVHDDEFLDECLRRLYRVRLREGIQVGKDGRKNSQFGFWRRSQIEDMIYKNAVEFLYDRVSSGFCGFLINALPAA